jgi:hypothetical protein
VRLGNWRFAGVSFKSSRKKSGRSCAAAHRGNGRDQQSQAGGTLNVLRAILPDRGGSMPRNARMWG